ncbi:MAG: endonuclease MutS2 [Cytophagales bacterium]|nr:MAG: endonuclease MutS2 [Cytophagales bacterium]TAF60551.1 MAG: endonuclease MutS2 [Cytophagales bacterium]
MLYPESLEQKIGFDKIRRLIKDECRGSAARELVNQMSFSADTDLLSRQIGLTDEFMKILQDVASFPEDNFLDMNGVLNKAKPEYSFLSIEEFFDLKRSLKTIYEALRYIYTRRVQYPLLAELCAPVALPYEIVTAIDAVIDETGGLKNNASPELQKIRAEIQSTLVFLRKRLDQILRQLKAEEWVKDDAEMTIREGRMVLPLRAEHKRHVKGIIHDTSTSGQTVFIEPQDVVELNNEIKELVNKEKREIIRILTRLTDALRPHIESLQTAYALAAELDFIRAKAAFSRKIKANTPIIQEQKGFKWFNVYHPLLFLTLQEQDKIIIPYDIELNDKQRILLISGPNAGGKSVCLKTVGLVQYMFQTGLPITAQEGSKIGVFKNLFIDIGDEQSIENDLSTYSSHLRNMKQFLFFGNKHSLCLIDEFGTGTEPQVGAAVAEAILEQINRQQCFGVITTHYSNLKTLAQHTEGIRNAAMRFDADNLEPLYELEIGRPGSSFALDIASKIGLPGPILEAARKKVGTETFSMEKLLADLDKEKHLFATQNKAIKAKESEFNDLLQTYNKLKDKLELNRKTALNNAKQEAANLLKEANRRIEEAIRGIKEAEADKHKTREIRKELDTFATDLKLEDLPKEEKAVRKTIEGDILVGDTVLLKEQDTMGEVLEIKGKDAVVAVGQLKTTVKLDKLLRLSAKEAKKQHKNKLKTTGLDLVQRRADFSAELDLRGARAEEAMNMVSDFIDTALLLSYPELRIIHGKGNGVLRDVVRQTLHRFKAVASISDEHPDRGGAGVSVVVLKH